MPKVVTYLYPDHKNASNIKVFQDRTNQIKAFYFTRDYINEVEHLESSKNYAVYFLFNQVGEGDLTKVYVGQSRNGVSRMQNHNSNKDFWSYCLMFVTDNDSFDSSTIDYMEYYFIRRLENSGKFSLENKEMRNREPNVSIYDKPTVQSYINQVEFLLNAEGVNLDEAEVELESPPVKQETIRPNRNTLFDVFKTISNDLVDEETLIDADVVYDDKVESLEFREPFSSDTLYFPKHDKYEGAIYIKEGKVMLVEGSVVRSADESTKNWLDNMRFHDNHNSNVDKLLKQGYIKPYENDYIAICDLELNSPSAAGRLLSGTGPNGWTFFEGLSEIRAKIE